MWRRPGEEAKLDDVVELLRGIGTMLMGIDAKVKDIVDVLGEEDDGDA